MGRGRVASRRVAGQGGQPRVRFGALVADDPSGERNEPGVGAEDNPEKGQFAHRRSPLVDIRRTGRRDGSIGVRRPGRVVMTSQPTGMIGMIE